MMEDTKHKILFDLTATQPCGDSKFHGGGKYGLVVFKRLMELAPERMAVYYDDRAYLAEEAKELIEQHHVTQYLRRNISLFDAARKESKIVYTPLLNPRAYPQDVTIITTQHGPRDLELPSDSIEKYYVVKYDSLKVCIKSRIIKMFRPLYMDYVKMRRYRACFSSSNIDFVTVSEHSKASFQTLFPELSKRDIKVFYSPSTIDENVSIADYKNPYGKYYLVVSANRWEKNGYRTLKGMDELFSEHPEMEGKVVVTGLSSWNQMRINIKNKERFVLLGYVDESTLKALYHHAYLFVYGTLNEGFGYPPLEAMHEGCPVIASATASIPEVCGDAVLYYNPYLITEMKMRVIQMEDKDTRDKYIKRGIERQKMIETRQKEDLDKLCKYIFDSIK